MTGQELIEWIEKNNAQDKEIIIQHRDSGGCYGTAERAGYSLKPTLIKFSNELYGVIAEIEYDHGTTDFKPNGILL